MYKMHNLSVVLYFSVFVFFRPSSARLSQAVLDGVSSLGGKTHGVWLWMANFNLLTLIILLKSSFKVVLHLHYFFRL